MFVIYIICHISMVDNRSCYTLLFYWAVTLLLQLHPKELLLGVNKRWLYAEIMEPMFLMQLQLVFTVFLLNILYSLFVLGKCLRNNLKNIFPIFVLTLVENGRLNQIILYLRFDYFSLKVINKIIIKAIVFQGLLVYWDLVVQYLFI